MPGQDYLIDDLLLCSNCNGSAAFKVLKIGIMRLTDKRQRKGEMTKNGEKKDETTESFVVHIMYYYKVYFCIMCSGTFVVNTLLRELLFLYSYIETIACESSVSSQLFQLCLKKLVLKSSFSTKIVLLPPHRQMKSRVFEWV